DLVDASSRFTFDPTAPAIDASGGVNGSPLRVDAAGVPIRVDPARLAAGGPNGVLLLAPTNRQVAGAAVVALASGGGTDLAATTVSAPASATPGSDVTYRVRVDNLGTTAASNVRLVGGLPPGLEVRSLAAGQGSCTWTATDLACELGSLAGGGSTTVTLTARPAQAGSLHLDLAASPAEACDPAPANNVATLATEVADYQIRRRLRSL
ncbi:MAG: hypothetical protein H6Q02_2718, partial [Acidobacteria bacterium]|nr:hypothetical protein [Acidobacteriota bacterium]